MRAASKQAGLSFAELARITGITDESINKYAQGRVDNPRGTTMEMIADALGVSTAWLQYGDENQYFQLKNSSDSSLDVIRIVKHAGTIDTKADIQNQAFEYEMALHDGYLDFLGLDSSSLIGMIIQNDEMAPTLQAGDKVLINTKDKAPEDGGIFAFSYMEKILVKRVEMIPNSKTKTLRMISDNHLNSNYNVAASDAYAIGRLVWYGRKI